MADADLLGLHTVFTSEGGAEVAAQIKAIGAGSVEAAGGVAVLDTAVDGLKATMLELLPALTAAAAIFKVFESTSDAQEATNQLAFAFKNVGLDVTKYQASIDAAAASLKKYGYTQADVEKAIAAMTVITHNAGEAMKDIGLAADLAAYKHISLEQAATVLGRAYNGSTAMLTRWGLVVKGLGDPIDQVRGKISGFAATAEGTLGGSLRRILATLTEFATKLGLTILGTTNLVTATDKIVDTFDRWGKVILTVVKGLGDAYAWLDKMFKTSTEVNRWLNEKTGRPRVASDVDQSIGTHGAAHLQPINVDTVGGATPPSGLTPQQIKEQADAAQAIRDSMTAQISGDVGDISEQQEKALDAAKEQVKLGEDQLKLDHNSLEALDQILQGRLRLNELLKGGLLTQQQATDAQTVEAQATADTLGKGVKEHIKKAKDDTDEVAINWGESIATALSAGLTAGMGKSGGMKKAFDALGKSLLSELGSIFSQLGQALISYGGIMTALLPLFTNVFTSGPAAITAGIALVALGSAFGAIVSGGGAAGTPSFAGLNIGGSNTTQYLTPNPNSPYAAGTQYPGIVQPVFNVIGPGDASAQSQIGVLLNNMARRGITAPGIAG